jgi:hypothetical protein
VMDSIKVTGALPNESVGSSAGSGAGSGAAPGASSGTSSGTSSSVLDQATVQMLSDADLGTMLRDIHHFRLVFFETPMPRSAASGGSTPATVAASSAKATMTYYEQKYLAGEGGRRGARADFDGAQMLMVGFPQGGFAVVLQAPGMGVVARADGYPNFEGVGPLALAAFLRLAPMMR